MGIIPSLEQASRPALVGFAARPATLAARTAKRTVTGKLEAIRSLDLFAGAIDVELERLAEASRLRRFETGSLMLRDTASHELVLLVHGRAKTTVPRGAGGEFAIGIFEPGDILFESLWAPPTPRACGESIALEDSTALFVPRQPLEQFLYRNVHVAFRLLEAISARSRRLVELSIQNTCMEVADRLYRTLLRFSQSRGRACADGVLIAHGLSQHDLAAIVGSSREVVNRQLARWRAQGLIESGRKFVIVKNPRALAQAVSVLARETELDDGATRGYATDAAPASLVC